MKASVEVSRVVKGLEEQIDSFEKRKLHDLKTVLLDFVVIELSFHAKTLELLTKAYQDIAEIDDAKDLEVSCVIIISVTFHTNRAQRTLRFRSNKIKIIATFFSQDFQTIRGNMNGVNS